MFALRFDAWFAKAQDRCANCFIRHIVLDSLQCLGVFLTFLIVSQLHQIDSELALKVIFMNLLRD